MEADDNSKEIERSTSKNKSQRLNPVDDEKGDVATYSRVDSCETSISTSGSMKSIAEMPTARQNASKAPIGNQARTTRTSRGKKKERRSRVTKRVVTRRRQVAKRAPKRKLRVNLKRKRTLSASSILTSQSGGSKVSINCAFCGHRCCRRRFQQKRRRKYRRNRIVKRRFKKPTIKCIATQTTGSECLQVGSACQMLSPLCIDTNATPTPEVVAEEPSLYVEVSPQMIYETVRLLTMWKQNISTIAIFEHVKRNYPVIQDVPELFEELLEKLQVAAIVGIIEHTSKDCWCLSGPLQKRRQLTMRHVTLFWHTYGDTMRPVTRKLLMTPVSAEDDEAQTSTTGQHNFENNSN